jgi:hypothetical protein
VQRLDIRETPAAFTIIILLLKFLAQNHKVFFRGLEKGFFCAFIWSQIANVERRQPLPSGQ